MSWLDKCRVLQETEHFKLVLAYEDLPDEDYLVEAYEGGRQYYIIFKPLGRIEIASSSFNAARAYLFIAEEEYEEGEELFAVGKDQDSKGNTIN